MGMIDNKYVFLARLALKYRLSLDNLCIIEGIQVNDSNNNNLFNSLLNNNPNLDKALRFLLTIENNGTYKNAQYDNDKVNLVRLGYETKGEATFKRIQAKKHIEYIRLSQEFSKLSEQEKKNPAAQELLSKINNLRSSISPLDEEERQYKSTLEIYKLDQQMREKSGLIKRPLTMNEVLIIAKYRLKFAISQEIVANDFGINYNTLAEYESYLSDEALKEKLKALNDYNTTLFFSSKRGFKSK